MSRILLLSSLLLPACASDQNFVGNEGADGRSQDQRQDREARGCDQESRGRQGEGGSRRLTTLRALRRPGRSPTGPWPLPK